MIVIMIIIVVVVFLQHSSAMTLEALAVCSVGWLGSVVVLVRVTYS